MRGLFANSIVLASCALMSCGPSGYDKGTPVPPPSTGAKPIVVIADPTDQTGNPQTILGRLTHTTSDVDQTIRPITGMTAAVAVIVSTESTPPARNKAICRAVTDGDIYKGAVIRKIGTLEPYEITVTLPRPFSPTVSTPVDAVLCSAILTAP